MGEEEEENNETTIPDELFNVEDGILSAVILFIPNLIGLIGIPYENNPLLNYPIK